jgi:hypothetical protein
MNSASNGTQQNQSIDTNLLLMNELSQQWDSTKSKYRYTLDGGNTTIDLVYV